MADPTIQVIVASCASSLTLLIPILLMYTKIGEIKGKLDFIEKFIINRLYRLEERISELERKVAVISSEIRHS